MTTAFAEDVSVRHTLSEQELADFEAARQQFQGAWVRAGIVKFFTDGVIEVENKGGSDFGIEGLRQSIRSNLDQPTESLLEAIIGDVYKFADSTVLTDDAYLVAAEL